MRKFFVYGLAIVIAIISVIGIILYFPQETESKIITLATTTSTDNSGLLDYLHPLLTNDTNINVDVVAVGTGAALELAKRGLADVVMVHARELEDQFIAEGYGFHRRSSAAKKL